VERFLISVRKALGDFPFAREFVPPHVCLLNPSSSKNGAASTYFSFSLGSRNEHACYQRFALGVVIREQKKAAFEMTGACFVLPRVLAMRRCNDEL
jgi:hypothetical protein